MEKILSENGLNFNVLEEEFFQIGCEIAANLLKQVLIRMDEHLEATRDKKKYRHKGTRTTTLKTLMGAVSYDRTIYETKLENGEKAYVYLLDQALELETFGKVTASMAARIAESVSDCSYRETAASVSRTTGQSISHGGSWNVIQNLGEKLSKIERTNAELAKDNQGRGHIVTPILFEEAMGFRLICRVKTAREKAKKAK